MSPVLSIQGAVKGAWLRELFPGSRIFVRHLDANGKYDNAYAGGVTKTTVTADGVLWAQSEGWPTILRLTESGDLRRFLLPCADPYLRVLRGPHDGVWFISHDAGCSGSVERDGIHVGNLPREEITSYL
ncbi:MAG: hypothetical protein M3Y21_09160 [Candidatus Eremiobacteraeota bacterium]|nr:hypothetical protein [Candidatus Eremiobacteraeota bacterium]